MQIRDLVKPLDQMSDAELHEHIRAMRHRRETLRPVAKAKAARVEKKAAQTQTKKVTSLLAALSEEERAALIQQLSEE